MKLIYMKEYLNIFSQEQAKDIVSRGELKETESGEPYLLIIEE